VTVGDIQYRLDGLAAEHGVRILYAAESGSRAWGFASPDSDWDVRFFYTHAPRAYLSVRPPRDVIEVKPGADGFDAGGWDLFKALALYRRGNSPLLEWLLSPLVYREEGAFAARLRKLAGERLPARPLAYHYLSQSRRTYYEAIEGRAEVSRKRYLYALRPLLCCRWIEAHGTPPPTSVADLLPGINLPEPVRIALDGLIAEKQRGDETSAGPTDPILSDFITAELTRLEAVVPNLPHPAPDDAALDALVWETLGI
jgi:predicted nucleotidyltransferase